MATCSSQGNVMNMDNMVIGGPAVYSYEDIPCANGECVQSTKRQAEARGVFMLQISTLLLIEPMLIVCQKHRILRQITLIIRKPLSVWIETCILRESLHTHS